MIKTSLILILLFFGGVSFAAQKIRPSPWIEDVKQAFREARVADAVTLLKKNQSILFKSYTQQKQITEWFTTFQFDSSLSLFEKLQEQAILQDTSVDIESGFKEILEKEPFNTLVLTGYIKFLIEKGKMNLAKEKIIWAQKEIPFLPIYSLLNAWILLKESNSFEDKFSCDTGLLRAAETDFCCYLKVLSRLKNDQNKKGEQEEIRNLAKRTAIPNVYYHLWQKWQKPADKQKYLSSCQSLSGKQKKEYFFVPEMCLIEEKERSE
jgi:hypothetical protein